MDAKAGAYSRSQGSGLRDSWKDSIDSPERAASCRDF